MKRMKMINKSQYYYTITLFQCLGNCAIIRDVTKLLFDNNALFFGSAGNGGPAFFMHKNPPARGGRCLLFLFFPFSSLNVVVYKPFNIV